MAERKARSRSVAPSSLPPEVEDIDASWDEDRSSALELDLELAPEDAFERITAVPGIPPEVFARRVMEKAEDDAAARPPSDLPPVLGGAPSARPAPDPKVALDFESVPKTALELADASVAARPPQPSTASLELDFSGVLAPPRQPGEDPALEDMKDRYATGDFTGALVIAEGILETDPNDSTALGCAQSCRDVLTQMYSARLGPLSQRISVAIRQDEIRWLSLDHRAGFLLSLVDGTLTIEELLDVSGMPRLEALRIVHGLFDQRVVALSRRD
ncbi:MAG TPA: hypothetical protein VF989_15485 [Polyangiaceae bacterium]|jgi:hypothetical protein